MSYQGIKLVTRKNGEPVELAFAEGSSDDEWGAYEEDGTPIIENVSELEADTAMRQWAVNKLGHRQFWVVDER